MTQSADMCFVISAWISNYIHYNTWDIITYPFLNFNGATVEVWEWISNFIPHFTVHLITYPCWKLGKWLSNIAAEASAKFQSNWKTPDTNLLSEFMNSYNPESYQLLKQSLGSDSFELANIFFRGLLNYATGE